MQFQLLFKDKLSVEKDSDMPPPSLELISSDMDGGEMEKLSCGLMKERSSLEIINTAFHHAKGKNDHLA